MNLPRPIRYFPERMLNHLTRKIARSSWGPFSILYHTGRHSGRIHETPVLASPSPDGFVVALTSSADFEWYRNVMAVERCKILWHRQETEIGAVREMEPRNALWRFPLYARILLRLNGTEDFLKMKKLPK